MKVNARYIEIDQLASAPANPADSIYRLYTLLSTEKVYSRDDLGVETLAAGGSFDFIQDVIATTPVAKDVLVFSGGGLVNDAVSLSDLTDADVITAPPTEGDVLIWNSADEEYQPGPLSLRIDDLNFTNFDVDRFGGDVNGAFIGYDTSFFNYNYQFQWPQIIVGNDFVNQQSPIAPGYQNTQNPISPSGTEQLVFSDFEVWNEFKEFVPGINPVDFDRITSSMDMTAGGAAAHRVDIRFRWDGRPMGPLSANVSLVIEEYSSESVFAIWDATIAGGTVVEDSIALPITLFVGDALGIKLTGENGVLFWFSMRIRPYGFYPEVTDGAYQIPNYSNYAD